MRLLTFAQLKSEKGVPYSRDHLRRKIKASEFPRPVAISEKRIGWAEPEIDEWVASKLRARDAG
jgi:prophage regulatory protein